MLRSFFRLSLLLAAIVVTGFGSPSLHADESTGRLDIYFIDVEGGAATLFVTPAGESLLIDSGYPDFNGRDRDRILKVVTETAGLKQIDNVAVTHWHRDHYGNHAALAAKIRIGNFWDRGIPDALQEDAQFVDRIADYRRASENQSKKLEPGDMLPLESGKTPLGIKIVTASRNVIANDGPPNPFAKLHVPKKRDASDNAASVSFLLSFGKFRFLCCGDLTWNIEAKLMTPNNPIGQVDMYMVTHHGLPSSNNPALVRAIDPRVAVMCNGPTKGGHPDVIKTLRQVKSLRALYQLHRNVKLKADEQTAAAYIANTEPTTDCKGVYVKASIAADGGSYTVQIGADGKPRTYKTR
ncbi:MAG: MBL fold metallo-hydrolase [Planctomycetaceae bacterium]|jgi:competence protein ComEC|nr:MBL fold metallo-hydrolase [Planctomycetaceae bacterium]MBT6155698.1 MBL fold metallo-hydrolase [Planctomycetaceae bacterium]MBT6484981.1 MBL fold metallo-hydrolase [Planctomycetaceae bacterium]MBT6497533.1 MBL fold metallo-hydrolase [Planctomycetaceae bacterium]